MAADHRLLLLKDAELLLLQYALRNSPQNAMDAAERRRWASEMVEVMKALRIELAALIPPHYCESSLCGEWNGLVRDGQRQVTHKGWIVRHPEHIAELRIEFDARIAKRNRKAKR